MKNVVNAPWVMGGDFNVLIFSYERLGVSRSVEVEVDLLALVRELNLTDLPKEGRKFTWSSRGVVSTFSRLDGFLMSVANANSNCCTVG